MDVGFHSRSVGDTSVPLFGPRFSFIKGKRPNCMSSMLMSWSVVPRTIPALGPPSKSHIVTKYTG